jgi:hypothetical protein
MTEEVNTNTLDVAADSPSIQTHLTMIQGVIQRMSSNSSACKAWCVTLVSAILVIVADKDKPDYAWIAVIPSLLFGALDVYYLALEKGFRNSYNTFIRKLHKSSLVEEDLYSINPSGNMRTHQIEAMKSFSVWGFYVSLLVLIAIARWVAL